MMTCISMRVPAGPSDRRLRRGLASLGSVDLLASDTGHHTTTSIPSLITDTRESDLTSGAHLQAWAMPQRGGPPPCTSGISATMQT